MSLSLGQCLGAPRFALDFSIDNQRNLKGTGAIFFEESSSLLSASREKDFFAGVAILVVKATRVLLAGNGVL